MSPSPRLADYDNRWYHPGRSNAWRAAWVFLGQPLFRSPLLPFSGLRVALLRIFGATVGIGVVIHSEVVVKYPWHLTIGDHCWIGERSWFDNLTSISLADNVCVSQGVYLCTGNHDWSDPAFGLKVEPIALRSGSWACARCVLLPGTVLGEGAIAAAGSVVMRAVPPFEIYAGNPAVFLRTREIRDTTRSPQANEVCAA